MSDFSSNEQMLDMYLFETFQNIEQLENCILDAEKTKSFSQNSVNEIFRIMHTIKGSSAMMLFNNISNLAHKMEDLFYFIREQKPQHIDTAALSDLLLEGVDFIKLELEKIKNNDREEGDCSGLIEKIREYLSDLQRKNSAESNSDRHIDDPIVQEKHQYYILPDSTLSVTSGNYYKAVIYFDDGCEMENIRAYTIIHNLKQLTNEIHYIPDDILDNDRSIETIRKSGFTIYLRIDKTYDDIKEIFLNTIFLKDLELTELEDDREYQQLIKPEVSIKETCTKINHNKTKEAEVKEVSSSTTNQSIISVNVAKLDKLMDLVGEMVIAESLVTQNSDLKGLVLDNFQKAARQLHKITGELQDIVMSIRMVPLSATFHKMHRLVRDMNKNLGKETELVLIGEETEVDKNIIEHISDPLMHLVRNSLDHGIESIEERISDGKDRAGKVILEAKNSGNDVLILIKDDGRGINKEIILKKAMENGLLYKPESEMTDREIYNLIFLPGFSTKDNVSEYSGRGVGMDVVTKNIEMIGGTVSIDSKEGKGTVITLKIPLTLAIIDGMNIKVGRSRYTIPITAIKESFRPKGSDIITDPDGHEMIMVRGNCYPILRLHQYFDIHSDVTDFQNGILIMVELEETTLCLFADELLGQQQVVVKALPDYIKSVRKIHGISGCTLLGDGSISLIIDISGLMK